jgi:hypothetical protein
LISSRTARILRCSPHRRTRQAASKRLLRERAYHAVMRSSEDIPDPVARFADRFLRFVTKGRGDGARGRNLYALRCLDAMRNEASQLHLSFSYRPTRNPAAFLALVFDLMGDALHGYLTRLEGGAEHAGAAREVVHRHITQRLEAPWTQLVTELGAAGFDGLANMVTDVIREALDRSAVSDLPAQLTTLRIWMTPTQYAQFDVVAYIRSLPFHRVLTLLRYGAATGAEQHSTGGDLRRSLRERLDAPWSAALAGEGTDEPLAFLAAWPFDVGWLADESDGGDFAVAYALATDAKRPGRVWAAPAPFVRDDEREAFESLVARGAQESAARRELWLQRWGVSATFPATTATVDAQLAAAATTLALLHAGGDWRLLVADRDALEVARRHFLQRVADALRSGGRP